jgi:16S rRNA (guanine966-N2)-methyltransferase
MRVVSGSAKGRRLGPVPPGVRPVSDRAREGLFSSLGPAVAGASVLDLFAGTGALGIEALSRGAARATFVDTSAAAVGTIQNNLDRTGLGEHATVRRSEAGRVLEDEREGFDLILADPPYDTPSEAVDALLQAAPAALSGTHARLVLTRPHKGYIPVIPVNLRLARELRYGDTLVLVYQQES